MPSREEHRPSIRGKMENALPSYASATSQDHWTIVAPYIASTDLCSAALVCERWHEMFAPHLWGNPASHFGTGDDAVYVALTRFRRTLAWARLYVRQMTHTLHMPPAHPELYDGPHSDWLRDILERLPNLQSLIVNGLPFFDHGSLLTLRYFSPSRRPTSPQSLPIFALRFLDARHCANATSSGLTEALRHFPSLLYLDLSRTVAARSPNVLTSVGSLRNLQILKLAGLQLRDEDIALLAGKLGTRLRSFDVRDNSLTDKSARILLIKCFVLHHHSAALDLGYFRETGSGSVRTPGALDPFNHDASFAHQTADLDIYIRRQMTTELTERMTIEDTSPSGITHLYIAHNRFTAEGAAALLRSGSLHVFDCGDVARSLPEELNSPIHSEMILPGVSKVLPVIAGHGSQQLTYLRINHGIVTEDIATLQPEPEPSSAVTELSADGEVRPAEPQELDHMNVVAELEGAPIPSELADTGTARYELPGDAMFIRVTPAHVFDWPPDGEEQSSTMNTVSSATDTNTHSTLHSSISPTSNTHDEHNHNTSIILNSSGTGLNPDFAAMNGISSPPLTPKAISPRTDNSNPTSTPTPRPAHHLLHRSYSSILAERRARTLINKSNPTTLHPSLVPKLSTLVLTDLPARTHTHTPITRITSFITACAEEASLARQQAELGYAMPPGTRGHASAQREYAKSIFALQRIVLELAPDDTAAALRGKAASWRKYPTKSSTEDADSEAFWDAAQYDFSFFGDEECGLPTVQSGRGALMTLAGEDKIVVMPEDVGQMQQSTTMSPQQQQQQQQHSLPVPVPSPMYDVVAEVARFRRERKAVYEERIAMGEVNPDVEGHFQGEVKVVRPPVPVMSPSV